MYLPLFKFVIGRGVVDVFLRRITLLMDDRYRGDVWPFLLCTTTLEIRNPMARGIDFQLIIARENRSEDLFRTEGYVVLDMLIGPFVFRFALSSVFGLSRSAES